MSARSNGWSKPHYATVQLSDEFRNRMQTRLGATRTSAATVASRLRGQLRPQLEKLDQQEGRYLDLVVHPTGQGRSCPPRCAASVKVRPVDRDLWPTRTAQSAAGYEVPTTVLRATE